jgi:hypothetical protein
MKKTVLLVAIIVGMIIDTKFDLIQQTGISESWLNIIKLLGTIISVVIAKNQLPLGFDKPEGNDLYNSIIGGGNVPPSKDEK